MNKNLTIEEKIEEEQAEEYFNNTILPKLKAREAGEMEVAGFWEGAVLNFLNNQTLNFIGTILKKIVLERAVDFAKWLMDQAENTILNLYKNASEQEKDLFKAKVKEVFPNSSLLGKL